MQQALHPKVWGLVLILLQFDEFCPLCNSLSIYNSTVQTYEMGITHSL